MRLGLNSTWKKWSSEERAKYKKSRKDFVVVVIIMFQLFISGQLVKCWADCTTVLPTLPVGSTCWICPVDLWTRECARCCLNIFICFLHVFYMFSTNLNKVLFLLGMDGLSGSWAISYFSTELHMVWQDIEKWYKDMKYFVARTLVFLFFWVPPIPIPTFTGVFHHPCFLVKPQDFGPARSQLKRWL